MKWKVDVGRRRRRRFDRDEFLTVCREAQEAGLPMRRAAMEVMDLNGNQADYQIRKARQEGLLPLPARQVGRDVHRLVMATINRGTPAEFSWLVCQICLTPTCERLGEQVPSDHVSGGTSGRGTTHSSALG